MVGATSIFPAGLPVPVDDGATAHLPGAAVPAIVLPATSGGMVALDRWAAGPGTWTVVVAWLDAGARA